MKKWFPPILIAFLVILTYHNIFKNHYVWDDHIQLENNPYTSKIENLPLLFTQDNWKLFQPKIKPVGYWRPLFFASYYIDHALPFSVPLAHHIVDLLIYFCCSLVIFRFLLWLRLDPWTSLIATGLFIAHPLHTEVTTFMGGRYFSFCAILWILSLVQFNKFWLQEKTSHLILSALLYSISLLCYELSIVFPLFLLAEYWREWKSKKAARALSIFLGITALYLLVRKLVVPLRFYPPDTAWTTSLLNMGGVMLRILKGLVWPFHYTLIESPSPLVSHLADGIIGLVLFILLLVATTLSLKHKWIWRHPLLWILIPSILVISPWPRGSVYQDRYTFLPSIGFCISIAILLKKKIEPLWYVFAICFGLSLIPATLVRNLDWRSDEALWCEEATTYPHSFISNRNCGWSLFRAKDFPKALLFYRRALSIRFEPTTANDYAVSLAYLGECGEAISIFQKLQKNFPNFKAPYKNEKLCKEK